MYPIATVFVTAVVLATSGGFVLDDQHNVTQLPHTVTQHQHNGTQVPDTVTQQTHTDTKQANFSYSECAPPGTVMLSQQLPYGTRLPPMPRLLGDFKATVEIKYPLGHGTKIVKEYFHGTNQIAAVIVYDSRFETRYILDYKWDTITTIQVAMEYASMHAKPESPDGYMRLNCTVEYLNASFEIRSYFESDASPNIVPKVPTASEALHLAKSNGLLYLGKSTIRDIKTDHWQSCMSWRFRNQLNYTMDMYFTDMEWDNAYSVKQIPVRWEIRGIEDKDGQPPFHMISDYIDFRTAANGFDENDMRYFEKPEDVICGGHGPHFPFPKPLGQPELTDHLTYIVEQEVVVEQVDSTDTTKLLISPTVFKIIYDHRHQLVMSAVAAIDTTYPFYSRNTIRAISDIKNGRVYSIDTVLGNCTVSPLSDNNYTVKEGQGERMKTISEWLLMNTTYQYRDRKTIRGRYSDVFVSMADLFDNTSAVVTHYFTQDQTPIKVTVEKQEDFTMTRTTYNIFKWNAVKPYYFDFDVTNCYDDDAKMPIKIIFKGTNKTVLQPAREEVLSAVVETLVNQTFIQYLQVQKTELQFESTTDTAVFRCVLVGPPVTHEILDSGSASSTHIKQHAAHLVASFLRGMVAAGLSVTVESVGQTIKASSFSSMS